MESFALIFLGRIIKKSMVCRFCVVGPKMTPEFFQQIQSFASSHMVLAIPIESREHLTRIQQFVSKNVRCGLLPLEVVFTLSNFLEVSSDQRKRHHYLPVSLYFKRFAHANGTVWEFNKKHASVSQRHIRSTGFETNLYSLKTDIDGGNDATSEVCLSKIESILQPTIDRIVDRGIHTPFDYLSVIYFVSLMFARSPSMISFSGNELVKLVKSFDNALYRAFVKKEINFIEMITTDDPEYSAPDPPADHLNIRLFCGQIFYQYSKHPKEFMNKDKQLERERMQEGLFQLTNQWLMSLLTEKKLANIYEAEIGSMFVTSDNPADLFFGQEPFRHFPLSNNRCLALDASNVRMNASRQRILEANFINELNRRMLEKATTRIYGRDKEIFTRMQVHS